MFVNINLCVLKCKHPLLVNFSLLFLKISRLRIILRKDECTSVDLYRTLELQRLEIQIYVK